MSADPKNNGTLICGLVADPELVNDGKIAKFRVAADYAGRDAADPENRSGYFDVVLYKDDSNPNNKFVFGQINDGKMKKGSQVAIVYRLNQSRWKADDGGGRNRVELVAEGMTYVGGARQTEGSEGGSEGAPTATSTNSGGEAAPVIDKF